MSVRVDIVATHTCYVCGRESVSSQQVEEYYRESFAAVSTVSVRPDGWITVAPPVVEQARSAGGMREFAAGVETVTVCSPECAARRLEEQHSILVERLMDGRP